jgi:signal transduction histidine kinase
MSSSDRPIHESQLLPRLESLEQRLTKVSKETESLQRLAMLGTVCAGIAHEINNLLTPALGYAQLARNAPDDSELQSKALGKSITAIETTAKIVRSMLGLSTADDQAARAEVGEIVADALACIGRSPARGIQIATEVDPAVAVRMRPVALQQVLMNLVLNALHAMQPAGGTLTISAGSGDDGMTIIEVRDSGPGIPPQLVERLFHPFVTSRSQASPDGGTGLGLTICRDLIEEAGGTITVSSSSDGAVFTIALPAALHEQRKAS